MTDPSADAVVDGQFLGSDVLSAPLRLPVRALGHAARQNTSDADHVPRATPASSSRPATGRCSAIRGSPRRISGRGSPSRATTASIPPGSGSPTSSTSRTCTATTSIPSSWPATSTRAPGCSSPSSRRPSSNGSCGDLGFTALRAYARTASRPMLDGLEVTIFAMTDAGRRAARRFGARARRRHGAAAQPERRPSRRPRRAAGPRPVRRALRPVLRCDLVPDRLRLPGRGAHPPRPRRSASTRWRAPGNTSRGWRPRTCSRARVRRASSTTTSSRSTTSTTTPRTSSPTRRCSSTELAAQGIDNAHLIVPGSVIDLDAERVRVAHPGTDAEAMRPFRDKAQYLAEYRGDWDGWLAAEHARRGRAGRATSSPSSRPGSSRCSSARRSRRPGSPATS